MIAYSRWWGNCWIMNQKCCGRSLSLLGVDWIGNIMLLTLFEGVMLATIFIVILLKSMEMWHLTNIQLGSVTHVNTTPNTSHLVVRRLCCVLIDQKLLCHSWQGIAQFVVCWVLIFFNESDGWCTGSFRCLCLLGFCFLLLGHAVLWHGSCLTTICNRSHIAVSPSARCLVDWQHWMWLS